MLIYYPNKDSCFGHATLPRSLPKFVPILFDFLRTFTVSSGPESIKLEVYGATEFDSQDHSLAYIKKATEFFGSPPGAGEFFMKPVIGKAVQLSVKWPISSNDFDRAVAFMVTGHPWPKQVLGPVTLTFFYDFIWRDPRTGQAFPDQGVECHKRNPLASNVRVDLQRNSFIAPDLKFPYELSDSRLFEMLRLIVPAFPFKPTVNHFRKLIPLKDGIGTKIRRLEGFEADRISEILK